MDDKIQFKKKDFNNYSLSEDRNIEIESLSKRIKEINSFYLITLLNSEKKSFLLCQTKLLLKEKELLG